MRNSTFNSGSMQYEKKREGGMLGGYTCGEDDVQCNHMAGLVGDL